MGEPRTAATMCEAFQATVVQHPRRVALRTLGGAAAITWERYADRVGQIAAGLASLGVRGGDTVALMMTNRPEFHLVDTAAFHLGGGAVLGVQHLRRGADRPGARQRPQPGGGV